MIAKQEETIQFQAKLIKETLANNKRTNTIDDDRPPLKQPRVN